MNIVMKSIREICKTGTPMYMNAILKNLNRKGSGIPKQLAKEDLSEILDYYKKLQVVHVDDEE